MNAYLISIGDEVLIGQTINTNASFIGSKLAEVSVDIVKSVVIKDNLNAIESELKYSSQFADLVIITGGLGPTNDDVTKTAIVNYFDTKLVQNETALEDIIVLFKKRGRKVTKINEQQAMIPEIAEIIRNSRGTAPGLWIEKGNKIFVIMPGVPYEMKAMMENYVIPRLKETLLDQKEITGRLILQTTGIPESTLFERLGNLDELLNGAEIAFLPNQFGVKLRITYTSDDFEQLQEKLNTIEQKIRAKAGRFIFSRSEESLEEVVAKILMDRGIRVSLAESCTGGSVSDRLTNISGSSKYFERGVVAYSNAAKVELLKVNEDTLTEFGAVSSEVAMQMAEGIRAISGTDIGISITGILGPTGATAEKPVGLVYIGLCDDKVCTAKKFQFGDDRLLNKQRSAQAALEILRRYLLGISVDD